MTKIYCISGLGADTRMYDAIIYPAGYQIVKVEWLPFQNDSSFEKYIQRHIEYYRLEPDNIIIGLSLGGIAASFIQDVLPQKKLFLISSIANKNQLRPLLKFPGIYSLYRLMNPIIKVFTPSLIRFVMRPSTAKSKRLLKEYIKKIDHNYINWVFREILKWEKESPHKNIIQIHGDQDRVFPCKNIDAHYLIKGGTHFMLRDKSDEISRILKEVLEGVD